MIDLSTYKHISFDLDGTLVHTVAEYRYKVVPEAIRRCGGNTGVSRRYIDCFWFESRRNKIIEEHFKLNPKLFWDTFVEMDTKEERGAHTRAYEDAGPAMRRLKESGKLTSIITGAPVWIADMEIEKLGGVTYDHQVCIRGSDLPHKPQPKAMFLTLEALSVKPEETLYIGNSNEDAEFAKNAGCDFLYLERKEHEFENTDWIVGVIESLDELFT